MSECSLDEQIHCDSRIVDVLKRAKTVAIVGVSHKEHRDSHKVAVYLKEHGYRIIPVNPKYKEVLGEPCYPDLLSVPEQIDIVDIFRNVDAIPAIVDEAIAVKAGCVWMQQELVHEEAAERARKAGLCVVMDNCVKIEHSKMIAGAGNQHVS